jgi:hypothetical protein
LFTAPLAPHRQHPRRKRRSRSPCCHSRIGHGAHLIMRAPIVGAHRRKVRTQIFSLALVQGRAFAARIRGLPGRT